MKYIILALVLLGSASAIDVSRARAVTDVVQLLQSMLDKSREDGNAEDDLYGKFKCYCDSNNIEKTQLIATVKDEVKQLDSDIEQLTGTTRGLTVEVSQFQGEIETANTAMAEADQLRKTESEEYTSKVAELEGAITAMGNAIQMLTAVGSQSSGTSELAIKTFMAPTAPAFATLKADVQKALTAANKFLDVKDRKTVTSFLQQPSFTGDYKPQSGAVVGILSNMKQTFETNLATARSTEASAAEEHTTFMSTKQSLVQHLQASYDDKQGQLSGKLAELSAKQTQHAQAVKQNAEDEDFLSNLLSMCAEKAKEYDERKMFRSNEEAAVAKAIFILGSENAVAKFAAHAGANTSAPASLLQRSQIQRHSQGASSPALKAVEQKLSEQARKLKSEKLSRVAVLLESGNPFDKIFAEIDNMQKLITEEAAVDTQQLTWCNNERQTNTAALGEKTEELSVAQGNVDTIALAIDDVESGIKTQISTLESALDENRDEQSSQTSLRTEENEAYKAKMHEITDAEAVLQKAVNVLKTYYESVGGLSPTSAAALNQEKKQTPPETWSTPLSASTQGQSVVNMLEVIYQDAVAEKNTVMSDEESATQAYDSAMAQLKASEAETLKSLVVLRSELATKEKELESAHADLHSMESSKLSVDQYLSSIKPGCDFITTNIDVRSANRQAETQALNSAKDLIQNSPAYRNAVLADQLGDCAGICTPDMEHVDCQACLAKVTVVGYCVSHPGTKGCAGSDAATTAAPVRF